MLVSHAVVGGGDWNRQPLTDQLPRLLEPMGIRCLAATCGDEAQRIIKSVSIHIAVVDLAIPLRAASALNTNSAPSTATPSDANRPARPSSPTPAMPIGAAEAGARLLQLLRRLESRPPIIVIRPPQPTMRESARTLAEALDAGAFAVLDRPVHLEAMLDALRRIVRRHYANHWPG